MALRLPHEMGGPGGGTNPEQLFAVGYAACFESALDVVGRRQRVEPGAVSINSHVALVPSGGGAFGLAVELDVALPGISNPDRTARLVAAAHEVCPYSNAVRGNVEVRLQANGREVVSG